MICGQSDSDRVLLNQNLGVRWEFVRESRCRPCRDSNPPSLAYPALACGANECRRWRDWDRLIPQGTFGWFFFLPVENLVNRQKLHDRGYLVASKGKIFWANMSQLPFAN